MQLSYDEFRLETLRHLYTDKSEIIRGASPSEREELVSKLFDVYSNSSEPISTDDFINSAEADYLCANFAVEHMSIAEKFASFDAETAEGNSQRDEFVSQNSIRASELEKLLGIEEGALSFVYIQDMLGSCDMDLTLDCDCECIGDELIDNEISMSHEMRSDENISSAAKEFMQDNELLFAIEKSGEITILPVVAGVDYSGKRIYRDMDDAASDAFYGVALKLADKYGVSDYDKDNIVGYETGEFWGAEYSIPEYAEIIVPVEIKNISAYCYDINEDGSYDISGQSERFVTRLTSVCAEADDYFMEGKLNDFLLERVAEKELIADKEQLESTKADSMTIPV